MRADAPHAATPPRRKSAKPYFPEEIADGVFRCGFNARDSWEHQKRSLKRLLQFHFEYVLAGHGGSIALPADEMRNALRSMLLRL